MDRLTLSIGLAIILVILGRRIFSEEDWSDRPYIPVNGPEQTLLQRKPQWEYLDWKLTGLAEYKIQARLITKERYRWDTAAHLCPIDLGLAWGKLANPETLKKISFWQDNRFLYFHAPEELMGQFRTIIANHANVHALPASEDIAKQLFKIPRGAVVTLEGYLVQGKGPNGEIWTSSLSRTDTGPGACEVFYIEKVTIE